MYPGSTEGGGKALVLLQVGQGVVVKLHELAGKPAAELVDALLHPANARFFFIKDASVLRCLTQRQSDQSLTCS